jgi:hypothetical protein
MKTGTVQANGVDYLWSVYRQPRWTGDHVLLGLAILVKPVKGSGRELVLEFSIDSTRHGEMPQLQRLRVPNRRLIECIQNALDAGWDPDSRGKGFFFDAGPMNPN